MNSSLDRHRTTVWLGMAAVFALVLAFYLSTLAPGVNWADGARMQMDARLAGSSYAYLDELSDLDTDNLPFDRLGPAAWDHPLWVMLAQIFLRLPLGGMAYRLNFMSAFFGALTASVVFVLGKQLSGSSPAAFSGAIALSVSHTFWYHAVTTEVYTLHLLFMALQLSLAIHYKATRRRNDLLLSAFVAGLGIANHRLYGITASITALYLLAEVVRPGTNREPGPDTRTPQRARGLWLALEILICFLLGSAPYWVQFLRTARLIGFELTLQLALTPSLIGRRLLAPSVRALIGNLGVYLLWLGYQFLPAGLVLGVWGFARLQRSSPTEATYLLLLFAANTVFSANFSIADQFSHHLSSFLPFGLCLACGAAVLSQRVLKEAPQTAVRTFSFWVGLSLLLGGLPVLVYRLTPPLLNVLGIDETTLGIHSPGQGARDTLAYFLNPDKRGDHTATNFGQGTLNLLPPGAVVFTPKTSEQETYVVLRYFQKVEGLRPDITLDMLLFASQDNMPAAVMDRALSLAPCRPLYISSLNPASFPIERAREVFDIYPEANLYRLQPREHLVGQVECDEQPAAAMSLPFSELVRLALRWE